jgi:hypothetical protein
MTRELLGVGTEQINSAIHEPPGEVNHELILAPGTAQLSCALVAGDAADAIHDVTYGPASSCAFNTDPATVQVNDPAVGVNVTDTRCPAPVPVRTPEETPLRVMLPVP